MIFCNGCSKTGTHIATNLCESIGRKKIDGTVVKRKPDSYFAMKGTANLERLFSFSNKNFVHSHIAYAKQLEFTFASHKNLLTIRNPRDVAVSWMRHRTREDESLVESKELLIRLISGGMFGTSVPEFYRGFLGWLDVENVYIIKFEDFIERKVDLSGVTDYLQADITCLEYSGFLGGSVTYTGSYSNWRQWWDADVHKAWKAHGGTDIEGKLKSYYEPDDFVY